ncbi:MAG: hypothetical protein LBB12_04605 [Holosporaceae bacterium]|jgi:hypothetical protein|nr:hypothetical protein [Holosporaceae bacterium]
MTNKTIFMFAALMVFSGCVRLDDDKSYNELNTFLSGDAEYIAQLQNQLMMDPNNKELQEKLNIAMKDARNRRDQEKNSDARYNSLQNEIGYIKNNNSHQYGYQYKYYR